MMNREYGDIIPILDLDANGLIYLIGELVNPVDPVETRRRVLLGGLAEWIGADGFGWIRWNGAESEKWFCNLKSRKSLDIAESLDSIDLDAIEGKVFVDSAKGSLIFCYRGDVPRTAVALVRNSRRAKFSSRELKLASIILEEVDWLYLDDSVEPVMKSSRRLTLRQSAIAALLLQGLGRKQIADEIGIPVNTLTSHIKEIYRKYGARSHAAFLLAYRDEYPSPPIK